MRLFSRLVLVLALAGCNRLETVLTPTGGTPGDLAKLAGHFAGVANYGNGPDACPRPLGMAMTVVNGRVQGEVRDPRTPNAAPSKFDSYIEFDGGMTAIVRALGDVLVLRGRFLETRFNGTLVPEAAVDPRRDNVRQGETNIRFGYSTHCVWLVRLGREA